MKPHDPQLKKGIVVQTDYGIATVLDMFQMSGESMVSLEFWRDITQGDHTFAGSVWPVERCVFIATSEQDAIERLVKRKLGEDYL